MKVVIQRVNSASVKVDGEVVGAIDKGLLLLVGFGKDDSEQALIPVAKKISNMRLFPDKNKKFDKSVLETSGGVLAVPQFTLFADTSKGRRPEFFSALNPDEATQLFETFLTCLKDTGISKVESGRFGAYMQVSLENDGPVTIIL